MPSKIIVEFIASFWPARTQVDMRERIRVVLGSGLGILLTALLARWWADPDHAAVTWLAAPLGASAVLIFAVPASPLAQPWPVIGGKVLSALVGAACAALIVDPAWAGAAAVAGPIALMVSLRCLHPPGGATALLAALSAATWHFAAFPMLLNSVLLVGAGNVYKSATGRRYPHGQGETAPPSAYLGDLLRFAQTAAYQRNFGSLLCSSIMSKDPVSVQFGDMLDEAWALMRERRIKALPVIDRSRRVVGIVTVTDFLKHAGLERNEGIGWRLRSLIRRDGTVHSEKPETVGQIVAREVRVASEERRAADLVPLFSEDGHHHIPIIDCGKRLVGIITQSELARALHRAPTERLSSVNDADGRFCVHATSPGHVSTRSRGDDLVALPGASAARRRRRATTLCRLWTGTKATSPPLWRGV